MKLDSDENELLVSVGRRPIVTSNVVVSAPTVRSRRVSTSSNDGSGDDGLTLRPAPDP